MNLAPANLRTILFNDRPHVTFEADSRKKVEQYVNYLRKHAVFIQHFQPPSPCLVAGISARRGRERGERKYEMGKTGDRNEEIGERGSENGNRDLPYGFPVILKELATEESSFISPCLLPLYTFHYLLFHWDTGSTCPWVHCEACPLYLLFGFTLRLWYNVTSEGCLKMLIKEKWIESTILHKRGYYGK